MLNECSKIIFSISVGLGFRTPTGLTWLGGGAILFVFMTDWRVILGRVPFVRGKFPPVEAPAPQKDDISGEEDS